MRARCVLPVLLLLALSVRASGADEVQKALAALRSSRTPSQRLAAVKKLGATQSPRAASALARLVAEDPDLEVRVRAAHALGTSRAPNAGALLLERVIRGGPLGVRDTVAWSLAQTPKAGRVLVDALRARGIRSLERGLLYGAMGRFRDEATRLALQDGIRDADPYVASEALRAFCSREDTKAESLALLGRILAESTLR